MTAYRTCRNCISAKVDCGDCGAAGPFVDITDYSGGMVDEAKAEAARRWNVRP